MTDTERRLAAALAEAVRDLGWDWETQTSAQTGADLAAALLPVVAEIEAEARAGALREAVERVQAVYDLQCPPGPVDQYVDRGAHMAHQWWATVLGGALRDLRDHADSIADTTGATDA